MCVCGCEYTAWAGVCACEHVGCVRPSQQVQLRKQLCLAAEGTQFWGLLTSATDSCLAQIRRGAAVVGVARRRPEAARAVGRERQAAGGSRGRPSGQGVRGRAEGAFKAPAPPTGEQCRESQRCLPPAHSVVVPLEL